MGLILTNRKRNGNVLAIDEFLGDSHLFFDIGFQMSNTSLDLQQLVMILVIQLLTLEIARINGLNSQSFSSVQLLYLIEVPKQYLYFHNSNSSLIAYKVSPSSVRMSSTVDFSGNICFRKLESCCFITSSFNAFISNDLI